MSKDGAIKIEIEEKGGELRFTKGKKKGGIGLSVLRRRLSLLYPDHHVLTHKADNERYGATLIVKL